MNLRRLGLVLGGAALAVALLLYFLLGKRAANESSVKPPPAAAASPGATVPRGAEPPAFGRVAGRVSASDGKAVAGAVVRLAREGDDLPAVARAGDDGRFSIGELRAGKWSASASAPGFVPGQIEELVLVPGGETPANFTLERGGRAISGMVTDLGGGPVSGALVEVAPRSGLLDDGERRAAAAFTGSDGRYKVSVAPGDVRHRVSAWHPDYVRSLRAVEVGSAGAVADFALTPAGAIEGVVRELGSGAPVPGAEVTHEREALAGLFGDTLAVVAGGRRRGSVTADAEGRFRIAGLEPGGIRLEARAPGKASPEPSVVSLGVAEEVKDVELFVGRGYAVRGKARYEDGSAAVGVEVEAVGLRGSRETLAGPDGAFAIEGLASGVWRLTAHGGQALPRRPEKVTLRDADVDGVELVLGRGATIAGRVEPATRAVVRQKRDPAHTMPGPGGLGLQSAVTRADGTFTLERVAPGEVTLEARAADGRRGEVKASVGVEGASGLVIELAEGGGIAGRVVDEGGRGVSGVVVNASRAAGGDLQVTMLVNGIDADAARAVTGADGGFALLGLDAGDYEVFVTDDAGARLSLARGAEAPHITVAANEKKSGVQLVVEGRDGKITGTVLGPDGKPLADAWVAAASIREPLMPKPTPGPGKGTAQRRFIMVQDDDEPTASSEGVLTDDDGRFAIVGLRRGAYRLLGEGLKGTARGMLERVETGSQVTLKLSSLLALEGRVTASGKPVTEFTVEISGPALRAQTFRDAEGKFRLERVDAGIYKLRVSASEGQATLDATVAPVSRDAAPVAVSLSTVGRVVGKVLRADGAPLAGAGVALVPPPDPNDKDGHLRVEIHDDLPTTASDGSFSAEVAAGRHMLLVLGDGPGLTVRKEVEVGIGQVVDVGTLRIEATP